MTNRTEEVPEQLFSQRGTRKEENRGKKSFLGGYKVFAPVFFVGENEVSKQKEYSGKNGKKMGQKMYLNYFGAHRISTTAISRSVFRFTLSNGSKFSQSQIVPDLFKKIISTTCSVANINDWVHEFL